MPKRIAALVSSVLPEAVVCLLLTALWMGRLVPEARDHLRDGYDAGLQTWQLAWVRHALVTEPSRLFQANALAPAADVLAFTEPLVGYGVLSLPFAGLGPVAAYNAVCFLVLALAPFAIAGLARELGLPRLAALLGALATSFGALTTVHLGYVTLTAWGGIALVFLAYLRLRRAGRWIDGVLLALSIGALGWCSLHLLAFALASLGFALVGDLAWTRRDLSRTRTLHVLAGLALGGLLLVPLAVPLARVRQREGFVRSDAERLRFAAAPRDFLATTSFNPGQAFLPFRSDSEKSLYPGTTALALSLLALAIPRRGRPEDQPVSRSRALGLLLVAVGTLGALGPRTVFYDVLVFVAPPLFAGIRGVARFALVAKVGFGLLGAAGAARLLAGRSRPVRFGLAALLVAAIALDQRQTASLAFRPEIPYPPVETFLGAAEPGGPILHLPASFRPYEARYLLGSMAHWKPIVNATISWVPERHLALAATLARDPLGDDVLETLERWPVGTLVVHEHALPEASRRATLDLLVRGVSSGRLTGPLVFPHRGGDDFVLGVARVRGERVWGAPGGGDPALNGKLLERLAASAGTPAGAESPDLPASIDRPDEGATVRGPLRVVGWAQDESGAAEILEVRVDGDRRSPAKAVRFARPDVQAALPRLGDCREAGYEVVLPFLPGDDGVHRLTIRFRARSGRIRTLDRSFRWSG